LQTDDPSTTLGKILDRLVVYCSDQAHASVDKAALIVGCQLRKIVSDDQCVMRGNDLHKAIADDRSNGLIPFVLVATLGTTPTCAFDALNGLGKVCEAENVWMHVDAAYAGSAFLCPEYRSLLHGVEYSHSFNFNPHKWMMVNFDCSAMWLKDRTYFIDAFNVDPLYLKHDYQSQAPDYRHWQIPLGRRFRSLKLWFVLRCYGLTGLRSHIRKQIDLAKLFMNYVEKDPRFEIVYSSETTMGLVCFRLKDRSNELNETLLKSIQNDKRIYLVPAMVKKIFFLRMVICSTLTEKKHIDFAWKVIDECATELLK
jgi:aromatic-L-amino-acid decarboxylase